MDSVKANVVANYLGGGWSALMGFAFVPLYIRFLGMEAYGLIGLFTLLQAWLALLDLGLTPTLSREMAHYQSGSHTPQSICDFMRSIERVYVAIALLVAVGLFFAAPWVASDWVHAEKLSKATVEHALAISGVIIGARWVIGLYRSALIGLQRQVWLNGCAVIFATLRGLGAVAVLAWVSPTIMAFFLYQVLVLAAEAVVLAVCVHGLLPAPPQPATFQLESLRRVWRFAAGMATITVLSILLMQVDKLLLSKLLPLTEFGYYALASTVAGALGLVVGPVNNAIYPRIIELVSRGETGSLAVAYHNYSQLLSLMVVPAAVVLSLFSEHVLLLWTRDPKTTMHVAPLVSVLSIGTMFNGVMHTPYTLQLAHGWTRFTVVVNSISVVLIVPLIYVGIQEYGAIAAAYIWAFLNAGYLLIAVPVMHRQLLPGEMWSWYRQDVGMPLIAVVLAAGAVRLLAPPSRLDSPWQSTFIVCVAASAAVAAALLSTPLGRAQVRSHCRPLANMLRP